MIVESEDNYGSIINTRIDGTVKSNASPTDSNATHSVPEVAPTSPLSSVSFHSLLENLASSLKTPVTGTIIPAFANVTLADIPATQQVGPGMQKPAASMPPLIGNPKKKRESNPNAALRPTKSNTARCVRCLHAVLQWIVLSMLSAAIETCVLLHTKNKTKEESLLSVNLLHTGTICPKRCERFVYMFMISLSRILTSPRRPFVDQVEQIKRVYLRRLLLSRY